MLSWSELHERKSIKATEVSYETLATSGTEVTARVDGWVVVHASIANDLESLLVSVWLRPTLKISNIDLILPLSRNLQVLQLFIASLSGLVSLESVAKDT